MYEYHPYVHRRLGLASFSEPPEESSRPRLLLLSRQRYVINVMCIRTYSSVKYL